MGKDYQVSDIKRGNISSLSTQSVVFCSDTERKPFWDPARFQHTLKSVKDRHRGHVESISRQKNEVKSRLHKGLNIGKHLLCGALSAAVCKTVVAPFERLRMDIILRNTSEGPVGAGIEVLRTEGILGFWRGNGLNIIRTAPFRAVNFYAFDVYNRALLNLTGRYENGDWERFTAGALSGITSVLACLPLDTIRTRMLSTRKVHQYNGFADCFSQIIRKEGVSALYKGCLPGLLSIAPGSAVFYGVYGTLKQTHLRRQQSYSNNNGGMDLPIASSLLYGAIAGMCAEAVVYPLEVIKRQIQLQISASQSFSFANSVNQASVGSLVKACLSINRTQGIGGFYAGVTLNTLQVLPSAALSYLTYEALISLLHVENEIQSSKAATK